MKTGLALATLLSVAALTVEARGDQKLTKAACIDAFDRAQVARREGALQRAHEHLMLCSNETCPVLVRVDCNDALRQVEAAQPTVILRASTPSGAAAADVKVELDGHPLDGTLDGRPVVVDPGKRIFVFRSRSSKPATVEIDISPGAKDRVVNVTLDPLDEAASTAASHEATNPPAAPAPTPPPATARSALGWSVPIGFGVLGAAALTFAAVRRVSLGNQADDLRATCAPHCVIDRDGMSSQLVAVNVALTIGLTSLAAAAITWLAFTPKSSSNGTRTGAQKE
jgi:hypothetical protein